MLNDRTVYFYTEIYIGDVVQNGYWIMFHEKITFHVRYFNRSPAYRKKTFIPSLNK